MILLFLAQREIARIWMLCPWMYHFAYRRVSSISACGYFNCANDDGPRVIHPRRVEECASKMHINYFPTKSETRPCPEIFTTSILTYRQIMFHDVAPLCRVSATLFRIIIARWEIYLRMRAWLFNDFTAVRFKTAITSPKYTRLISVKTIDHLSYRRSLGITHEAIINDNADEKGKEMLRQKVRNIIEHTRLI